ncbi:hypothetical protein JCM3766R1_003581 [Sporobolomyces carnicolor]
MTWDTIDFRPSFATLDDPVLETAFPSLRFFFFRILNNRSSPDRRTKERLLSLLLPQLGAVNIPDDRFAIDPLNAALMAELGPKALFDLDLEWERAAHLPRAFVRSARLVRDEYSNVMGMWEMLDDGSYRALDLLILSPRLSEPVVGDENLESTRLDLLEACRQRKIEIVYEDMPPRLDSKISYHFWRRMREVR